ncbi:MAG: diguanylate cyclase, partial [Pseudomonadota bacterium]
MHENQVLQEPSPSKQSRNLDILYVEDDMADATLLRSNLEKGENGIYRVTHTTTFGEALNRMKEKPFGAILLDLNVPDGQGLDGIDEIRKINPNLPVIIITGTDDERLAVKALEKGAQEYIVKDHANKNIIKRVLQLSIQRKKVENELAKKAYTDSLTGLKNRSAFEQSAKIMLERAKRWKQKEALVFIDLNKFKPINDRYGHEAGNIILKEVAQRLCHVLRKSDLIARYGGDEFICYLDSNHGNPITQKSCKAIALKISEAIERPIFLEGHKVPIKISASIGMAIFPDSGKDFDDLLRNADIAMYEAKRKQNQKFCFIHPGSNIDKNPESEKDDWLKIIKIPENDSFHRDKPHIHDDTKFSEFAFLAAHDLRAPIRKITAFSQIIQNQYESLSRDELAHLMNRIHISSERVSTLIDGLLMFANITHSHNRLEHIYISEILDELLEDLEGFFRETKTKIIVSDLPKLLIYRPHVRQIFLHLILNAVQFKKDN